MAQESTPYDIVIADLESKRDQIGATIEMLKALRSTASISLPLAPSSQRPSNGADIALDAFFGMTLPDAAKKYLSIARVTKSNPELCDALLKGGFKTQSANFPEVVRSQLGRHPDFVKINGQWGLAEWYGNRGGGRKAKRNALPSEDLQDDGTNGEPENPQDDTTVVAE
jgi:hypothetical protein